MADLATMTVSSALAGDPGRSVLSARGNHVVVDSPPPLGGPNEAMNPVDVLLGALSTCGTFVCETAAREMGLPLRQARVTVEGDFDPRGVKGVEGVSPRFQAFRVTVALDGVEGDDAERLLEAFRTRCPVFTTLERAADTQLRLA